MENRGGQYNGASLIVHKANGIGRENCGEHVLYVFIINEHPHCWSTWLLSLIMIILIEWAKGRQFIWRR
jgi:hypothetical protein